MSLRRKTKEATKAKGPSPSQISYATYKPATVNVEVSLLQASAIVEDAPSSVAPASKEARLEGLSSAQASAEDDGEDSTDSSLALAA